MSIVQTKTNKGTWLQISREFQKIVGISGATPINVQINFEIRILSELYLPLILSTFLFLRNTMICTCAVFLNQVCVFVCVLLHLTLTQRYSSYIISSYIKTVYYWHKHKRPSCKYLCDSQFYTRVEGIFTPDNGLEPMICCIGACCFTDCAMEVSLRLVRILGLN